MKNQSEQEQLETFARYGSSFQKKILQAILMDRLFAEQMSEVFKAEYFELKYLEYLSEKYFAYSKKYGDFPSVQLLLSIVRDELKSSSENNLKTQILEYLREIMGNPNPGDLPLVKEQSLDFCRKQALKVAILNVIDLIEKEKYETIVDVVKVAVSVGTTPSIGHDFFDDPEYRFNVAKRDCIPTGFPELDHKDIFNGGLAKGELGVVVGAAGSGKSHFLVMVGASALKLGKNVLHYTLELSDSNVGLRYDSHLCDIPSNEIIDNKEKVLEHYKNNNSYGRLIIKEYPMNMMSVQTIRAHVEKLTLKGFRPDVIIIDYADIMRSTKQYDSLRHELHFIYQELRGYSTEQRIAIWTASQSNRDGVNSDVIDMTNLSESYGKAFVADIILTISRKQLEKSSGYGRLFVCKSRAGRDGFLFNVKIDTACSKFEILGNTDVEAVKVEGEADFKKALKAKLNSWQSDAEVKIK
jgi:replicative DNA helicase